MRKQIDEKLYELHTAVEYAARNQADEAVTTYLPGDIYVNHVEYLLKELEETKRQSEQWELKYYREKNKEV